MTVTQEIITIALCVLATVIVRFLPFIAFSSKDRPTPKPVKYLGQALPAAIFSMLVVFCLKNVQFISGEWHGLAEIISIAVVVVLHLWKRQMILSIAAGTIVYMILIQFVFV